MNNALRDELPSRRVGDYLDALASAAPAPGGGSAAGLAGAMACALGEMVCGLTLTRNASDEMGELRSTLSILRDSLTRLAEQDERAFSAYRDSTALPRSTTEEKRARRLAMEAALVAAADVPMQMAGIGLNALDSLRLVALEGNVHALGDLLTGGYLLEAMIRGSLENVEANMGLMKSEEHRAHFSLAAESARANLKTELADLRATVTSRST